MYALDANKDVKDRFRRLRREELRTTTILAKPMTKKKDKGKQKQEPGEETSARGEDLAWFWTMDIKGDMEESGVIGQCECFKHSSFSSQYHPATLAVYRIHWLQAKARHDRWQEELSLTEHEMVWISRFFRFKANEWKDRAMAAGNEGKAGHAAYGLRQSIQWGKMEDVAWKVFKVVNPTVSSVWGAQE
jgi:hypothetical protein